MKHLCLANVTLQQFVICIYYYLLFYLLLECGTFGLVASSVTFSWSDSYSFGNLKYFFLVSRINYDVYAYCFIAADFTYRQGNTMLRWQSLNLANVEEKFFVFWSGIDLYTGWWNIDWLAFLHKLCVAALYRYLNGLGGIDCPTLFRVCCLSLAFDLWPRGWLNCSGVLEWHLANRICKKAFYF